MGLLFEPPQEAHIRYAVYFEGGPFWGTASLRTYGSLGSAKNGYHAGANRAKGAKILENIDGSWFTLYDIPAGTTYANLPWVKEVMLYGQNYGRKVDRAVPMTREEYAAWRLEVERERLDKLPSFMRALAAPGLVRAS